MNNELPPEESKLRQRSLDECFADKPQMRRRLLEISDMIDTLVAQGCTAHEAEARAIEQIRKLGHGILSEWAEKSEAAAVAKARAAHPQLQPYRKKTPDLAYHLRTSRCAGATAAARSTGSASAAFL